MTTLAPGRPDAEQIDALVDDDRICAVGPHRDIVDSDARADDTEVVDALRAHRHPGAGRRAPAHTCTSGSPRRDAWASS
ncbi:hypothetical protein [Streptomyces phaeoluteigriseus]|uniref:hypothetical protein n=1 Tax=Streptomyces phaeoluteigriseus TaxID=114686 RepID=UPI00117EAB12|nr:hypothetical protein [Streptomyces phaeoluteigriseus]